MRTLPFKSVLFIKLRFNQYEPRFSLIISLLKKLIHLFFELNLTLGYDFQILLASRMNQTIFFLLFLIYC